MHLRLVQAACILSGLSALVGAIVFAGWMLNIAPLRDLSGPISMKTNTALSIVLAGVGLLLLIPEQPGPFRTWLGRACGVVLLLIGSLTLLEHITSRTLGIDQLLATEPPGAAGVTSANRMGPPASLSFMLLGPALLLLGRDGVRRALFQPLALVVAIVALAPTVGYLYGVDYLYGVARYTGIAWPTAAAILAISVALLCARPAQGLMAVVTADDPGGQSLRRLLVPIVLLPLVLGWVSLAGQRRGWYAEEMGAALRTIMFIVIFCALAYASGRGLSRATRQIQRQGELLAVTLASIGDGVIVTDALGRITFINAEAQRLTGWSAEDAAGQPLPAVFKIINEETRQPVESPADKALRMGTIVGLANHTILVARDGREIHIDDSGAPVRSADGIVHGVVLVFRDFSEQKAAEKSLQRLNRTLTALSKSSQAMMRAQDEAKYLNEVCRIIVSDCGHAMVWIGYAEEDENKTVRPVAHAGFDEGYIQALDITWSDTERGRGPTGTAIRTGQSSMCRNMQTDPRFAPWREEAIQRGYASSIVLPLMADGKAFGALTIYSREPDPFSHDEVKLLSELADDLAHGITAIRLREAHAQAEGALRHSEQRYRSFVEASAQVVWTTNAAGEVAMEIPAWQAFTGQSAEEARGFGWTNAIRPEDRSRVAEAWRKAFDTRGLYEVEYLLRVRDGSWRNILARGVPVLDAEGRVREYIGTCIDITEQRQVEADLLWAKAAAEQANAAKDEFIATLSHELRTPLTPVLAAAGSMLKDPHLSEDVREDLKLIHRNVGLEVALINDLLDVTRIAAGKVVLDKRPVDAAQVLRDAARICSVDLDGRSQTLTIETPGAPYPMEADEARLHQVFWNLIKNAIKFTPQGGRIAVEASIRGKSLVASVSDTGIGIDPALLPRLFNRFEQGEAGTTRTFGGLGLGLAISKAIVEMHGGRIWATSEGRDRGATFTVELPLAPALRNRLPASPDRSQAPPSSASKPMACARSLKILLVEDHADTAKLMSRLLMAEGHTVVKADSVKAALSAAAAENPDLIISDLGLPDGTGHDLLRQLLASGKSIKAIALSGYGAAADIQKSLDAGFVEHLTKPVDFDALHHALQRIAATSDAGRPRRST